MLFQNNWEAKLWYKRWVQWMFFAFQKRALPKRLCRYFWNNWDSKLWNGRWVQEEMVFAFLAISWSVGKAPFNSSRLNREIFDFLFQTCSYHHVHIQSKLSRLILIHTRCFLFLLLDIFIQPSLGSCRAGPRVYKPRNPCGSAILSASQEVSNSFGPTPIYSLSLYKSKFC